MDALTFIVFGFAAYRASRAVAIDTITQPLRDWAELRSSRAGHWFDGLISCGWCVGFWLAGVTYAAGVFAGAIDNTSLLQHLINWWAVAGVQAILIALDTYFLREAPPK